MNKTILMMMIGTALIVSNTYNFAADSTSSFPDRDSIFLKTHWKQMGGFEQRTPDHLRLGCWSTALAQIMYYHHLKPFGHVAYRSSKGYNIDEHLDNLRFDWSQLAMRIDTNTSAQSISALAEYNYCAALAANKDFGTDNYMHKLAPAGMLETHYAVKVSRYISWNHLLPYSSGRLEHTIIQEISRKRPLFLHFSNLSGFGHSVVIDG